MKKTEQAFWWVVEKFRRGFVYFAVLRPSFIFGAIIVYLPLTAYHEQVPGSAMLANLFVEYDFWKGFWFGFALFGAVWAHMLTTCITLDFARDRQSPLDSWLPDPGKSERSVAIPIKGMGIFLLFSLLAMPAVVIVVAKAGTVVATGVGLALGAFLSFVCMNLVAALVHADNEKYQVFPWRALGFRMKGIARFLRWALSRVIELVLPPDDIYEDTKTGARLLKDDPFYAAISAFSVIFIYGIIYWLFKPTLHIQLPLENVPPAGFIYALLLPLIWIVSALWVFLYRYRFAFYLTIVITFLFTFAATRSFVETTIGGPTHTYDVVPYASAKLLDPKAILDPLKRKGHKNLIIVAASGGGILAAGWTGQVLTKLHEAYPEFSKELRLISSVSGGSVGAAHYVNSLSEVSRHKESAPRAAALRNVAKDTMRSSLASTAYGVAFPDFKRVVWPFWVDQEFDRARLIEADWRRISNCRKQALDKLTIPQDFRSFCRQLPTAEQNKRMLLSEFHDQIEMGDKPAMIFNATVMETGERVGITPISTLRSRWSGLSSKTGQPHPVRHAYARTLSEYLAAEKEDTDPSKVDQGERKNATCDPSVYHNGYDIDLWTAARLSATFSYVSPAARAACFNARAERVPASPDSTGRLHLIDGGYHDNYGVASALNWLTSALEAYDNALPVSRIALIEIRAKPDIPKSTARTEWSSAWLGPFWGLLSSWGYAQTSANDTAVDQFISRFKKQFSQSVNGIKFESFVFVPDWSGPLSWHLSTAQKKRLCEAWSKPINQITFEALLQYLGGNNPKSFPILSDTALSTDTSGCAEFGPD